MALHMAASARDQSHECAHQGSVPKMGMLGSSFDDHDLCHWLCFRGGEVGLARPTSLLTAWRAVFPAAVTAWTCSVIDV